MRSTPLMNNTRAIPSSGLMARAPASRTASPVAAFASTSPSEELVTAAEAWRATVHSARDNKHQPTGRARSAPTGRSLYDQQPHRIAGTHPLPLHIPLTTPNWRASVAVWSTVEPDADEMKLLDSDPHTICRLLEVYGLPTDLLALRGTTADHISARSWLYAAVGDAVAIADLPPATHAFVQEHAPALWLRLDPTRDCLELLHALFWLEIAALEVGRLPPNNARFQRLLRLLPSQVRTLGDVHPWMGEGCMLTFWFSLRVDNALIYVPSSDRVELTAGAELLKIGRERFTQEPETCLDAWFLQYWVLRARLGERAAAEEVFRAWNEAHPDAVAGHIAWADALAGNAYLDPVDVGACKRALDHLELLDHRTGDDNEKWSIRTLRGQIEAMLRSYRRAQKQR